MESSMGWPEAAALIAMFAFFAFLAWLGFRDR